jgi:8-oxo-dGTP pyrophosphatase MutT (NUDIX family)
MSWQVVRTEVVADCRVFKVRRDVSHDRRDSREHDFFVIEAPDWINVVPLTVDGQVILIEQYRHGSKKVTLEIPGGMVDEHESPEETAVRELLEETGYRAGAIELLGRVRPNPAIQNNWLHSFVARDCVLAQPPQPDSLEQIDVRLAALEEVPRLIAIGAIDHALVIAAFYYLFT